MTTDKERLDRIYDAIFDPEFMTEEELRAEMIEEGLDPAAEIARIRADFARIIRDHNQRRQEEL